MAPCLVFLGFVRYKSAVALRMMLVSFLMLRTLCAKRFEQGLTDVLMLFDRVCTEEGTVLSRFRFSRDTQFEFA